MTNEEGIETAPQSTPAAATANGRDLDLVSLKALAHPLRVQIFDALSTYGSFTASGLAERLAESSGATSYHLRQLEKHGLVREVAGKGTSRERWWERTPGSVNIGSDEALATPAGRSAANTIFRQMRYHEDKLISEYVERAVEEVSTEWHEASAITTTNTRLTVPQLREFVTEVMALQEKYLTPFKNQNVPGSRPVHVVFNAFPVIDGAGAPEPKAHQNP